MCVCICTCLCVCICTCLCVSLCVHVCVCVFMCVSVCLSVCLLSNFLRYCSFIHITTDILPSVETILNNMGTRISGLIVALDSKVDLQTSQLNKKLDDLSSKLCGLFSEVGSLSSKLDTLLSTSPSQNQQLTTTELAHLQTSLNSTQSSLANQTGQLNKQVNGLYSKLDTLSQHTAAELVHLQNLLNFTQFTHNVQLNDKLDGLSSKLDTLNTSLSQHQQQTTAELAHFQTFLNCTNSKLDSLKATAAQLSSDHQKIQTNISDVQCMDTQQSLQDNLTQQSEMTKENVTLTPKEYSCGGTGGWRRVVYLNMTDPHTSCPSGWNMTGYSKRTCGRNSTGRLTCDSATFPVSGGKYSSVCSRIKAYQWGATQGFKSYHNNEVITIDGDYADGVSVTHGTPRNHIWTFVAGLSEINPILTEVCPCDTNHTIRIPPFVGNDYFCESGVNEEWWSSNNYIFHPNDTLWDGEDCLSSSTCCSQHNPPYFTKQLPTPTTDDIEARICMHPTLSYSNLAVELVELYVQ